jgi:hypothetical protein
MQALGFTATWATHCFINGGCGRQVFAHTNGYGDFVLFDSLGWPWPVHNCYANRFVVGNVPGGSGVISLRPDRIAEYGRTSVTGAPPARHVRFSDIFAVNPLTYVGKGEFPIAGYIQDYHERRADTIAEKMGTLGQQLLHRLLGLRRSQLTIITTELKSYTVFADLRNTIVRQKDMVLARVEAVRAVGIRNLNAVFLAKQVMLIQGGYTGSEEP